MNTMLQWTFYEIYIYEIPRSIEEILLISAIISYLSFCSKEYLGSGF